jgi:hypothetical protein
MKPVDIQRVRHVPRELLRSSDLRVQRAASQQRRWWHNRALHDVPGIASGMTVALANKTKVEVQPGVAYDCFGRELLLFEPRTLKLPPGRQRMTLDACYRSRESMAEAELHWRLTSWGGCKECIPLAELSYESNGVVLKTTELRARPLARPRIGYGTTPVEGTPWQPWLVAGLEQLWVVAGPGSDRLTVLGLQVGIDTTAAGFTETPCYFAWLQWPQVATSHLPYWVYLALGFQYVEEPRIDRFQFRALLPALATDEISTLAASGRSPGRDAILSIARGQRLSVCWLGIQHEPDLGAHEEGA